jgi:HEAT repeat protein
VRELNGVGERGVPTLIGALKAESWLTRVAAADALGRIGVRAKEPDTIVSALVGAATDPELKVRQMVIASILRIGRPTPASELILTRAETDDDPLIRTMANAPRQARPSEK